MIIPNFPVEVASYNDSLNIGIYISMRLPNKGHYHIDYIAMAYFSTTYHEYSYEYTISSLPLSRSTRCSVDLFCML